ncbi:MAG: 50S ribosomal protein L21 [Actinomycetaceae bacterium]|nr:50S ribosomal protein L21 [Actinomycetaceae bacterium]
MVYAIVKAGGRQEKVSVGDVIVVDRLDANPGDEVTFQPVMIGDGDKVTINAAELAEKAVKAEVIEDTKGPKISIIKYKNKTGYRKRIGHRQKLTSVKITAIA